MAEPHGVEEGEPDGFIQFWATGQTVKGEFHCAECAYGVTVYRNLPLCPMCGGTVWEQAPWSPLTRAQESGRARPLQ